MDELDDAFCELYLQVQLPSQPWLFDPSALSISSRVLLASDTLPISQGQHYFFLFLQLSLEPPAIFLYSIKKVGIIFWGIILFLSASLSIGHFQVFKPLDQPLIPSFLAQFYSIFISSISMPDPTLHYDYANLISLFKPIIYIESVHSSILLSPNSNYCFSLHARALRIRLYIYSSVTLVPCSATNIATWNEQHSFSILLITPVNADFHSQKIGNFMSYRLVYFMLMIFWEVAMI